MMASDTLTGLAERCMRLAQAAGDGLVADRLRVLATGYRRQAARLGAAPVTQQQQQIQPPKED